MAASVSVADSVIAVNKEMHGSGAGSTDMKKRRKAVLLCLSPDLKTITIDEGKQIHIGDCGGIEDVYKHFIGMLPRDDCRYGLYNASFETKEGQHEGVLFIFWNPDSAPMKNKVVYGAAKEALKRKLEGIKFEIEAKKLEDIQDRRKLAVGFGGATVVSWEDKPV
ncbi:cofilin-2-like [Lissotriton helveticus]